MAPKLKQMYIAFDRPDGVYLAGGTISGTCVIDCNEPLSCKEVRLKLHGTAYVRFSRFERPMHHGNSRSQHVTYHAEEIYLSTLTPFLNKSMTGGEEPVLPVGVITFPWSFTIPPGLPSSFEGDHGSVRYYASCTIDRPWKFDKKAKCPFTVVGFYDLNRDIRAPTPLALQTGKTLCCSSGSIVCQAQINKQGFVPGENIIINAEIENNTGRRVNYTRVVLYQEILYEGYSSRSMRHSSKADRRAVCELRQGRIEPRLSQSWKSEALRIPPIPPTDLGGGCRIIRVSYHLDLMVDPNMGTTLHTVFPVFIGTIPLQATFRTVAGPVQMESSTAAPSAPTAATEPTPTTTQQHTEIPPPSYDECVFGAVDTKEDDDKYTAGNLNFAPKYPCYNLQ